MAELPTGGQMIWKMENNERVLHLRRSPLEQWRPYEEFPEYALPDPAGFSRGIATFLALLKQNWVTIKS
jgi:hypothetical protein